MSDTHGMLLAVLAHYKRVADDALEGWSIERTRTEFAERPEGLSDDAHARIIAAQAPTLASFDSQLAIWRQECANPGVYAKSEDMAQQIIVERLLSATAGALLELGAAALAPPSEAAGN